MSEDNLYALIQKYYDSKDKEQFYKSCDLYHKYKYKIYLDIINKYINEYK